jgi:cytochrome c-type biogenesis protein CcmH
MQLRCPVCQGSSIQESPSAEATAMKEIVRERLSKGESEDEIKAYFVSRYGDWILLAPPAHGINLLVYILPVVLLAAGGFFVYRTAKSWTNAAA